VNDLLTHIYLVFALFLGSNSNLHYGVDAKSKLPTAVRKDLDRRLGSWHLVTNKAENTKTCPGLIEGDFDGDGQEDYAIHVVTNELPVERQQRVILYLRKEAGFVRRTISQKPPSQLACLILYKKGARDYRYDLGRYFRYRFDTVGLVAGMGGVSYLYERGKFNEVVTVD
jgi:hypothetical protein